MAAAERQLWTLDRDTATRSPENTIETPVHGWGQARRGRELDDGLVAITSVSADVTRLPNPNRIRQAGQLGPPGFEPGRDGL